MIAQGQHTICDLNDITTGSSAPTSPVVNQLWCDTSISPNQLRKWNGSTWEVVNEVKVGGRNLFHRNVQLDLGVASFDNSINGIRLEKWGSNNRIWHIIKSKEPYTVSFYAKTDVSSQYMYVDICDMPSSEFLVTTEYRKVSLTVTPLQYYDSYEFVDFGKSPSENTFFIKDLMIELGNIATDWTPAPEDVAADIASAQTAANAANAVIAKIADDDVLTPSEKQQALREWLVAVSEKPLNVTQASSLGVDSGAYSSAYDSLASFIGTNLNDVTTTWTMGVGNGSLFRNRFSSYYTARTNLLNAISTKVNTSATNANTKIDGLSVGGRNYYKKTSTINKGDINISVDKELDNDSKNGFRIIGTPTPSLVRISGVITKNGNYVISFYGKANGNPSALEINACDIPCIGDTYFTTNWKKFEIKVTVDNYSDSVYNFIDIENIQYIVYSFKDFKIELGNKATDYSEAPEDIQARIDAAKAAADAAKSKVDLLDYLKDNMIKGGTVEAGMYLANILAVKNAAGMVTGGMNGLTDGDASKANVGLWMGGTLEQAALRTAMHAFYKDGDFTLGGGRVAFDVATLAMTIEALIRTAKTGARLEISNSKNTMTIYDSAGLEKVIISPNSVTPRSEIGGNVTVISTTFAAHSDFLDDVGNIALNSPEIISLDPTKFYTIVTPSVAYNLTARGTYDGTTKIHTDGWSQVSVSLVSTAGGAAVWTDTRTANSGNNVIDIKDGTIASKTITGVKGGNYKMVVSLSVDLEAGAIGTASASIAAGQILSGTLVNTISEIGLNGFNFIKSATEFLHLGDDEFTRRGYTDIPGVLATGSVASGGGLSNEWGAKKRASNVLVTKGGTGIYNVPHQAGSTYSVQITPTTDNLNTRVTSKGNNTFQVTVRNMSGTAVDTGSFDFTLYGAN